MKVQKLPPLTAWISYTIVAAAAAMYALAGGGCLVLIVTAGGIGVSLAIGHIPLKPYFVGPLIVLLYLVISFSSGNPLFVPVGMAAGIQRFIVFLLNFIFMVVLDCNIFYLYFRRKTAFGLAIFNCYNLLLTVAVVTTFKNPNPLYERGGWIILLLFFAAGFFINRQAILDQFRQKKAAGREFVSGIIRGSRFAAYAVFLIMAIGIIIALTVSLNAGLKRVSAADHGSPPPIMEREYRFPEASSHDLKSNAPDPSDVRVKMMVHVRYTGRPLQGLYMKGRDYDSYTRDGRWYISRRAGKGLADATGGIRIPRFTPAPDDLRDIRQEIRLFLVESTEIYSLERPAYVFMPFEEFGCKVIQYGGLSFMGLDTDQVEYTMLSSLPRRPDFRLAAATEASFPDAIYTRIPSGQERTAALGAELARNQISVRSRIEKIKEYLADNCRYNLEALAETEDPVSDFLFKEKEGVCVHFASAFVIMARGAGIPSRYCTGYMRQFPSSEASIEDPEKGLIISEHYILRQMNAHAWAEVFIPDAGWLTIETVPATGLDLLQDTFGTEDVNPAPPGIEDHKSREQEAKYVPRRGLFDRFFALVGKIPLGLIRGAGLGLGLALLAAAFFLNIPSAAYGRFWERIGLRPRILTRVEFFNAFLLMLEKQGQSWRRGETALEFTQRMDARLSPADGRFLAREYNRVRFGGKALTDPERVNRIFRGLKSE